MVQPVPDGLDDRIGHASIVVHGAPVYLSEAPDDMEHEGANPTKLGGTCVLLHQYVDDVDAVVRRAAEAGATVHREPSDQFYGDRAALLRDRFGHLWSFHSHVRDVTDEEMAAAMEQMSPE